MITTFRPFLVQPCGRRATPMATTIKARSCAEAVRKLKDRDSAAGAAPRRYKVRPLSPGEKCTLDEQRAITARLDAARTEAGT